MKRNETVSHVQCLVSFRAKRIWFMFSVFCIFFFSIGRDLKANKGKIHIISTSLSTRTQHRDNTRALARKLHSRSHRASVPNEAAHKLNHMPPGTEEASRIIRVGDAVEREIDDIWFPAKVSGRTAMHACASSVGGVACFALGWARQAAHLSCSTTVEGQPDALLIVTLCRSVSTSWLVATSI